MRDLTKKREYARIWIQNRRQTWFANKVCVNCGSTENLELDHINPTTKIDHKIWSWTESRRLEELEKCQVLCEDCHLIKSINERNYSKTHGMLSTYNKGCRCLDCKQRKSIKNKQRIR